MKSPLENLAQSNDQGQHDLLRQLGRKSKLTEAEALDLVNATSSLSESGRDPTHLTLQKQWFMNIAWYLGITDQDQIRSILGDFSLNVVYPPSETFHANLMYRMLNYQIAQLTSGSPDMSVVPKSSDQDDQFGARVAEYFLAHYDDVFNLRGLRREAAEWLVTCGTVFRRDDWDALAGGETETFKNPYSGTEMSGLTDEQKDAARKMGSVDKSRDGDMEIDILSPFQVVIPRKRYRMRDMNWMVFEYEKSIDWVLDHYPKKRNKISPDDFDSSAEGQYFQRLRTLVPHTASASFAVGSDTADTLRIRELWIPPSDRFPKGVWIRALHTTVLDHGPHPYADAGIDVRRHREARFPVSVARLTSLPGRFWGMSLAEHLIGPQADYSRARDQAIEQAELMGHPQWLVKSGVSMASKRVNYGDIWEFTADNYGDKPELQPAPSPSTMHMDRMDRAESDMMRISSQGEATQGDVPTGLRSGAALRALQEKDNLSISPAIQELEEMWEESSRRLLILTNTFLDKDTAIQVYGSSRANDIQVFKGTEIFGNTQVRVRRGSMMPKSRAEAIDLMFEMVQTGLINPENQAQLKMAYESMQIEGAQVLFEGRDLDERNAEYENMIFQRPSIGRDDRPEPYPMPRQSDDDEIHLEAHELFEKTPAYEKLPEDAKLAFEAHKLRHKEAIQRAMMALAAQQQAMMPPGAPPGGGGGSPPRQPGEASQPRQAQPTPGTQKSRPQ